MTGDLLSFQESSKEKIWKIIQSFLPQSPGLFKEITSEYPSRQGKYIRPLIFLLAYFALGGVKSPWITAAAIQTAEDWLIIHDDVEDSSPSRRGKPSLHVLYGNPLAINTGDSLHLLMWQMLIQNTWQVGIKTGLQILNSFENMLSQTTYGQFQDLSARNTMNSLLSQPEYLNLVTNKTASYTTLGPLRLACILSEKDHSFDDLATYWGQAYQINNDISGLKNSLEDLQEQKCTLPLILAYENCSQIEQDLINQKYLNRNTKLSEAEAKEVFEIINNNDGILLAQRMQENLYIKTRKIFNSHKRSFMNPEYGAMLEELITLSIGGNT